MVNKESDEKKDCRCNKQQKVSFWLWTVKLERINSPELVFAWLQDARASSSCLVVVVVHQLMLIAMQVLAAVGSPKGCSPQRSSASKTSPQIECLPSAEIDAKHCCASSHRCRWHQFARPLIDALDTVYHRNGES